MIKIICIFVVFIFASIANATDYYVQKSGSSDSNPCTQASPCLTINEGLSKLSGGDTLIIGAGTYLERIINAVPSGISWAQPTTVRAATGEVVTLRPPNETQSASNGFGRAVYLNGSQQYIVFDSLIIDGSDLAVQPGNGRFEVSGTVSHIAFQNSEMKFVPSSCIRANADNNDIRIINNKIHDNAGNVSVGGGSTGAHGIYWSAHNGLIEGNDLWEMTGHGMQLFSSGSAVISNNVIRNNIIRDHLNGNGSILLDSGNAFDNKIYNNLMYNVKSGITSPGNNGNEIYNNTVFHTTNLECIRNSPVGTFSSGAAAIIKNNIFFDCAGTGNTHTPSGNFTSNPSFVNSGTDNFRLQSGSSAVDTAATIAFVTDDIEGNSRPQGSAYDYGAYELVQGGDIDPPSIPTGLAATVNSSDLITWDWTDSTGSPANYRIRCCSGAACSTFTEVGTPAASRFTYSSLTASTLYRCQVAAEDAASNLSDYSTTVDASTIQAHSEQVEAEDMSLISPMTIASEAGTFGGDYISPTSGIDSTDPVAEATANITVPESGHYYLWGRIKGELGSGDALYAGIDSSFDRFFPVDTGTYQWIQLETTNDSGIHAFLLTGAHTVQVGHGEVGARLDAMYLTSDSTDVPPNPGTDTTPPTGVAITDPIANQVLKGTYLITATAQDETAMDRVEFKAGEILLCTDTTGPEPWTCSWDTTIAEEDIHQLKVIAYDTSLPPNTTVSAGVNVIVNNIPDFPGVPTSPSTTVAASPTFPGVPTGASTP